MAEKIISVTLMWSLSETLTTNGPVDDDFVHSQVLEFVRHKLDNPELQPYIISVSADVTEDMGAYVVSLEGEETFYDPGPQPTP